MAISEEEDKLSNLAAQKIYDLGGGCFCFECTRKNWREMLRLLREVEDRIDD